MENLVKLVLVVGGAALVSGLAIAYNVVCFSYVIDIVWDWFARPYFNAPDYAQKQFMALIILRYAILPKGSHNNNDIKDEYKKDKDTNLLNGIAAGLFAPWLLLATAWIVKTFVM